MLILLVLKNAKIVVNENDLDIQKNILTEIKLYGKKKEQMHRR